VREAANSLPLQSRIAGLALFGVGVVGLLLIIGRRLIMQRRRQPTPLPTPDRRR
jgi:hypothetical protein